MYNVVLIGCGYMGETHIEDIYKRDDICIYGVADIKQEKAREFASKYNAKSYDTDYMRYMLDEKVDIIICATYPSTHLQILKDCIKYKKHLLCEKPIAPSLEEGWEFISIAKEAEIKVSVGYILRFNESYKKVAQMIQNGAIGSPIILRMTKNHNALQWDKYLALIKDTSPLIDCGVHYVDICRWFTGAEITEISGIAATTESDVPEGKYNYAMTTMKLSDGSAAYYEVGWSKSISDDNTKEFIGPKGRIKIIERNERQSDKEKGDLIEYYDAQSKQFKNIDIDCKRRPTGAELDHLIDMIENNVPAKPLLDDVYKSFEIVINADKIIRG